jgi:hypothetical protein
MENNEGVSFQAKIARIVSVIFNPLFIPVYGLLIIFTAPTLFWYIPLKIKKILLLVVATNNILVPVTLMPFFRYRNLITTWIIESRKDRVIPLIAVSLFYSITSFIIFRLQIPAFIKAYLFSITLTIIALTIINLWWKVSLYSAGAGVLAGIVIVLSFKMMVPLTMFLIPVILAGGLIMASRLKLNTHSPSEVYLGFLTGFAGMMGMMILF